MKLITNSMVKKGYFKRVPLLPFNGHLEIILSDNPRLMDRFAIKRYPPIYDKTEESRIAELSGCYGLTIATHLLYPIKGEDKKIILLWTTTTEIGIIAHEVFHVITTIAGYSGAPINDETTEWGAYYMKYLIRCVVQAEGYKSLYDIR